jgi:hypothetical protein
MSAILPLGRNMFGSYQGAVPEEKPRSGEGRGFEEGRSRGFGGMGSSSRRNSTASASVRDPPPPEAEGCFSLLIRIAVPQSGRRRLEPHNKGITRLQPGYEREAFALPATICANSAAHDEHFEPSPQLRPKPRCRPSNHQSVPENAFQALCESPTPTGPRYSTSISNAASYSAAGGPLDGSFCPSCRNNRQGKKPGHTRVLLSLIIFVNGSHCWRCFNTPFIILFRKYEPFSSIVDIRDLNRICRGPFGARDGYILRLEWNDSSLSPLVAGSQAWGKHHEGEAIDRGLRQHIGCWASLGGLPLGGGHRLSLCRHHRSGRVSDGLLVAVVLHRTYRPNADH